MKCKYHNCQNTVNQIKTNKTRLFCDKKCQNKYFVDKRRLELKFKAIQYKGGKCEKCNYIGSIACYDFHHKDPTQKSFSISHKPHTRSWDRIKLEIDKCLLLCANCHREVEFEKTSNFKLFIPELIEKYKI